MSTETIETTENQTEDQAQDQQVEDICIFHARLHLKNQPDCFTLSFNGGINKVIGESLQGQMIQRILDREFRRVTSLISPLVEDWISEKDAAQDNKSLDDVAL